MNKAELVEALSQRFDGDKKTANNLVDTMVDTVVRTVSKGEKVSISGFGTFEKRERAARTARNPATGERVRVRKTSVPAFRPGQGFKDVVSGAKKLPRQPAKAAAKKTTEGKATGARRAGTSTASRTGATRGTTRTTAKRAPAKKAAPATARRATATRATSTRAPARKAPARTTTARKSTATRRTARAR